MKRRNFLKSLISTGVMLSPLSAIVQNIQVPGIDKEVTPEAAFDRTPYGIVIHNMSQRTIENVDIFGSAEYLNNAGFTEPNRLLVGGVEISCELGGKAYIDLLYDLMINPATFDKMILERSENKRSYEQFEISTRDAAGNTATVSIMPSSFRSPYDEDADSFCIETAFRVDGFTKMTFHNLKPDEKIACRFYPGKRVSENQPDYYWKKHRAERFN